MKSLKNVLKPLTKSFGNFKLMFWTPPHHHHPNQSTIKYWSKCFILPFPPPPPHNPLTKCFMTTIHPFHQLCGQIIFGYSWAYDVRLFFPDMTFGVAAHQSDRPTTGRSSSNSERQSDTGIVVELKIPLNSSLLMQSFAKHKLTNPTRLSSSYLSVSIGVNLIPKVFIGLVVFASVTFAQILLTILIKQPSVA